jgi:hypothetical protein
LPRLNGGGCVLRWERRENDRPIVYYGCLFLQKRGLVDLSVLIHGEEGNACLASPASFEYISTTQQHIIQTRGIDAINNTLSP